MFKYINMPKLVAFYLKEFSIRSDDTTSFLYKFIFCLCLPFLSNTFYRARMNALAVAECTSSEDQILRVLQAITGVNVFLVAFHLDYYTAFDDSSDTPDFPYDNSTGNDNPLVPYSAVANAGELYVKLNGVRRNEVEAYLDLLIPFYVQINVNYF